MLKVHLKEVLNQYGYTLYDLSDAILDLEGISESTVYRFGRGGQNLTLNKLELILRAVRSLTGQPVRLRDLISSEEETPSSSEEDVSSSTALVLLSSQESKYEIDEVWELVTRRMGQRAPEQRSKWWVVGAGALGISGFVLFFLLGGVSWQPPSGSPANNSTRELKLTSLSTPSSWQTVSESPFGWLTFPGDELGSKPNEGKGNTRDRFSLAKAPDNSLAVQHTVKTGDEVHPLGADSPILLSEPYKAARLSYKIWIEADKGRGQPGKYMSLMGGRGQAGGRYENGPQTDRKSSNAEGWSYYLLSPVTSGTKGVEGAMNGHHGAIGSANRSELDSELDCHEESLPGGDPINGDNQKCSAHKHAKSDTTPTGRWVEVVMTVGINTKGNEDGFAKYALDGKTIGEQKDVMWALDPDSTLDLWMRWGMMYGGTTRLVPAKQDVREWYKDFSLQVIY